MSEGAKRTAIYGLYDPKTGELRYIGKSIKPRERWLRHCRPKCWPSHKAQPVSRWCEQLYRRGLKPEMRIFTWCVDWNAAEKRLIAAYRKTGADLLNVSEGGWPHIVRPTHAQAVEYAARRSLIWQKAAITLDRRAWEIGEPAKVLLKEALNSIKAVRRKIQRERTAKQLERFDVNAYSHIVLDVVRDFPVLPFHPAYDNCWTSCRAM